MFSTDLNILLGNIFGGIAHACIYTGVGHPFDTVKVRLQSYNYGIYQSILYIYQEWGLRGFYKGVTPPLISHVLKRSIQYPMAEAMKVRMDGNWRTSPTDYRSNYIVGFTQAPLSSILGTPLQVAKIRSQTSTDTPFRVLIEIHRTYGVRGLYRGFVPTLMKDTLFGGVIMGNYFTLRDRHGSGSKVQNFLNGGLGTALAWTVLMPIDNIKTNIQNKKEKMSIKTAVMEGYRQHGTLGFWRGLGPTICRVMIVSGTTMTGYEEVRKWFHQRTQ